MTEVSAHLRLADRLIPSLVERGAEAIAVVDALAVAEIDPLLDERSRAVIGHVIV